MDDMVKGRWPCHGTHLTRSLTCPLRMIRYDIADVNPDSDKPSQGRCHDILGSELVRETALRDPDRQRVDLGTLREHGAQDFERSVGGKFNRSNIPSKLENCWRGKRKESKTVD